MYEPILMQNTTIPMLEWVPLVVEMFGVTYAPVRNLSFMFLDVGEREFVGGAATC